FFSSRRRHTRSDRDWSSDVCSSDLPEPVTKIVAVSATRRTDAGRERVALNTAYVRALARAGLVPLIVPPILDPDAACAALDGVQGLVLTGGEDVDPAHYHAAPTRSS